MPNSRTVSPNALDVLVVGGGPCGLATAISITLAGHRATVFEASDRPHPFGAGLQSGPNGTRLLSKWGLDDLLKPTATAPKLLQVHDLDGRLLLRREGYDDEIYRQYGFPLWTFHRIDLQAGLLTKAIDLGARVRYSSRVTGLDASKPSIELENGEKHDGDLVAVADGTWSILRSKVLDRTFHPQLTGEMAYRITIGRGSVQEKELLEMMDLPQTRFWVGPGLHAVGYTVRGGEQFSLLLIFSNDSIQEESSITGLIEEIRKRVEGMDSTLTTMLKAVQRVNKWRQVQVPPLPARSASSGVCVLAGDSSRSMCPILGQGLGLGLEDAATLGCVLSHVTSPTQLMKATALYERLRAGRTEKLVEEKKFQENKSRLGHGNTEMWRDDGITPKPNYDLDCVFPTAQNCIWEYDAVEVTEKAYLSEPY